MHVTVGTGECLNFLLFPLCFRINPVDNFFQVFKYHVITVVFGVGCRGKGFTTVAEQECVGITIVKNLCVFVCFIHVNLSHGIDAIQGVGLDVENVAEAVRMMFFIDAGDRYQCTLLEASEFVSF